MTPDFDNIEHILVEHAKQMVKATKEYSLLDLSAIWQRTLNGIIVGISVLAEQHPVLSKAGLVILACYNQALHDLKMGLMSSKTHEDIETAFTNHNKAINSCLHYRE